MTLNLYNNNITGKLPESMINLQLLNSFNITSNYLDVTNTDYLKSNPNFANWRIGNQKLIINYGLQPIYYRPN